MKFQHKLLAKSKWNKLSFFEQMANIGAEVGRAINWKNKKNLKYAQLAFYRSLELLYLTIADKKNQRRLKELCRLKEVLIDYFVFDNQYKSNDKLWQNYFYGFNYAARNNVL